MNYWGGTLTLIKKWLKKNIKEKEKERDTCTFFHELYHCAACSMPNLLIKKEKENNY